MIYHIIYTPRYHDTTLHTYTYHWLFIHPSFLLVDLILMNTSYRPHIIYTAIKEYQDFLASGKQEITKEKDGTSVIVKSATQPTSLLADAIACLNPKKDDIIVIPGGNLPASIDDRESYPIYITLPPQELNDFLQNLPEDWKPKISDFVFLSGGPICGVIEPILKKYGYARDTMTQLLCGGFTTPDNIFGTIKPRDLSCNIGIDAQGESKWAGETATCGKWAGAVQERFETNDIRCKAGFYREWRRLMWERAAFDSVFNLVGAVRDEPTTPKQVAEFYEQETSDMLWQVTSNLRGWLAVTLLYGFEERLFTLAEFRYGEVQCAISEEMFPYIFCAPLYKGDMMIEYLNYGKDTKGLIPNVELPKCDNRPSAMLQGNLRADGVV